ncbi:E3 ubiquitin-protein ligase LRSAM1 isoform X2 [Clupea harengus]|uniref:E3 ubiquitin-protein ligase LRSAM1 isoform X2 n=1 Tax=Clupea harengus TaxID=7950 RepID=A0A6P8G2M6_CLUHA|nr:E3 ubiquitin-protein ligase LRSAM1 isoform X2 [Clupea harengus]
MPLFFRKRKPSEDAKKRLEHQLYMSKEVGADDVMDISSCELSEAPTSAFSLCKMLHKKAFNLSDNELKSLIPKGCSISSLVTLQVLDIRNNKLTSLPDDIGQLTSLQVLNVEKNHLKGLPKSIGDLCHLKTLNLKGNCLNELPALVGHLRSLKTLDLSENNIRELPKDLAHARCLESLTLDTALMTYPHSSVCAAGTEAIQQFLCAELGLEYCPPSECQPAQGADGMTEETNSVDNPDFAWQSNFLEYQRRKDEKNREKLLFEQDLEEKRREHTQLVYLNNSHKENILLSVREQQERLDKELSVQQQALDLQRQQTLRKVQEAESSAMNRITSLLQDNSRQVQNAEILQAMEQDRIHMEQLAAVTHEEANSLRKRDVAVAMQKMLSESFSMRLLQEANEGRRQSMVTDAQRRMEDQDMKLEQLLSLQQLDKSKAVAEILQEEEMQKAAFEALQLQKDTVHGYLRNQIMQIEAELMQMTKLEVKRRDLDTENLQFVLADQRTGLLDMLQVLLKQKDQREQELRQLLVELERKSESNLQNYWMIQYQRLLDSKPLSLAMQEAGVEHELVSLLSKLSAEHYLPILAHHRITAEALRHMTAKDLSKIGVNEVGIQRALLNWAKTHIAKPTKVALPAEPRANEEEEVAGPSQPSAPSPEATPPMTPSAPGPPESPSCSECVVCMERGSQVIFLPCGHVCCCYQCNESLQTCPLCRAAIDQRLRLYYG